MFKDARYARPSHKVFFVFLRAAAFLYSRIFLGFRCRDRYKIKKGERLLVLSNHQTDGDPLCLLSVFSTPVYPVATDTIFSGRLLSKFFNYLSVIPKKKGAADLRSVLEMLKRLKGGASVLLFPEGNRYYAEFQYYIAPAITGLIKRSRATLVLFNLHGGAGVSPRFKNKMRRGRFFGEIKRVLPYEEYAEMNDDELFRLILEGIRVYDSESGEKFKSSRRAEYLERMLFCCPKCGAFETIYSKGADVGCNACGMSAEFTEDLHLRGLDGYDRLIDWWEYQRRAVRDKEIVPGEVIFHDDGVKLSLSNPYQNKELLAKGELSLTDTQLRCGERVFDIANIASASVVSGRKISFVYEENDYVLLGGKRFNPLKYVFALNRLDTAMHKNGTDKYFNLEEIQ